MAKRRHDTLEDSESSGEGENSSTSVGVEEDYNDASYRPPAKASRQKRQASARKGKKKLKDASDRDFDPSGSLQVTRPHLKSIHNIGQEVAIPMRIALVKWYKGVHKVRGMPWRKEYNPRLGKAERAQRAYEVWISEIMLQQTQVATVIPYYNRWMQKFPTIRHLATAKIDEINALWKGLGYYSRASRLLDGAQKAVRDFSGMLPGNAKDLEDHIPGIGRYSAGAISSIAYGERVPVLDGNVHRLLSRVLALHANPKAKGTLDLLWKAATAMSAAKVCNSTSESQCGKDLPHSGDVNQALIELGSTVCKVRDPDCGSCPLRSWCSAYRISGTSEKPTLASPTDIEDLCRVCEPFTEFGGVTSYPMKAERKKPREELDVVNVIEWRSSLQSDNRHFLMVRRPAGGLLAGLYEFPSSVNVSKDMDQDTQSKSPEMICSQLLVDDCPSISQVRVVGEILHVFSHIRKTYRVQWAILEGDKDFPPALMGSRDAEPPMKKIKSRKSGGSSAGPQDPRLAMWVPHDEVANTNMGTGVVKIWDLIKRQW